MGRDAKRAKQARRDKRGRRDERETASVTVHTASTPEEIQAAIAKMFSKPKTGDWRPDVIGVDKLSMQPGPDGWPLINGHRVTREMCTALQTDRPDQADHFVYEDIVEMAQELGPPEFGGLEGVLASSGGCTGLQLDHRDGSMSCSRGFDCPGVALPHAGWTDCDKHGPCAHCEGPPVQWVCDQR